MSDEADKQIINLEARIAEFERAIEERFKPRLRKAILAALDETAAEFLEMDLAEVREALK